MPESEDKQFGNLSVSADRFIAKMAEGRKASQGLKIRRSTYTKTVATAMRPYYIKAIEDVKSVFVPRSDFPSNKIGTLYKKVADGLLYLRDKLPEEDAEKYDHLRQHSVIQVDAERDGVWIKLLRDENFSERMLAEPVAATNVVSNVMPVPVPKAATFLSELEQHLEMSSGMFERVNLDIPEDMQKEVQALCEKHGAHAFVNETTIRVFKS